ncbi:TPA: hypothetical protein ACF632_000523 [Salmonella enterica]
MSMKRLTDERIAALIDMVPLNEAIVDIKSALIELQERRKAAGEQAGLFIRVNNMFFQVATAGNDCDESVRDQAIPLYTEPQFPDLKSEKSSLPVSKFDNEYIRTSLQSFSDTDEIVGWLLELADEYEEAEYDLREAINSLRGMYDDLKDFGNELIRLQGNQVLVKQPQNVQQNIPENIPGGNSPVIPEGWALVPKKLTTEMRKAAREVFGIDDIDIEWSHLLAAAPKPENAK